MGKRADERKAINTSLASQPDRVRWVVEILGSVPSFSFAEHEGLLDAYEDDYETAPTVLD